LFDAIKELNDVDFLPHLESLFIEAKKIQTTSVGWLAALEECILELKTNQNT
jgi:hypothetical protein